MWNEELESFLANEFHMIFGCFCFLNGCNLESKNRLFSAVYSIMDEKFSFSLYPHI